MQRHIQQQICVFAPCKNFFKLTHIIRAAESRMINTTKGLTVYQCFLRKQIELFEVGHDEMNGTAQGRNTPLHYGQVGIRCRHCAHLPKAARARGGVYYSRTIDGVCKLHNIFSPSKFLDNLSSTSSGKPLEKSSSSFFYARPWQTKFIRSSRPKYVETAFSEGLHINS